ncbi:MAG: PAS domain-containing sensor histidine kinase [Spirochaetota bacterium]
MRNQQDTRIAELLDALAQALLATLPLEQVTLLPDCAAGENRCSVPLAERTRSRRDAVTIDRSAFCLASVCRDGEEVTVEPWPSRPSRSGYALCVPVGGPQGTVAAAVLLRREDEGPFAENERRAVRAIVAQTEAALTALQEPASPSSSPSASVSTSHVPYRAHLEGLFANAPEAVVFLDEHHRILRANDEFVRMFGYGREELVGELLDDVVAPAQRYDEAREISSRVESGEGVSVETRRKRRDGSEFDVSILGGPVYEKGRIVGIFGIYRDVTEQKRTEAALRDSETRYREIFERAPVGIFRVHCDGRFLELNGTVARILGYGSPQELEAALAGSSENLYVRPGDRERLLRALQQHGAVSNFQFEARHRAGHVVTLSETSRIAEWRSAQDFLIDGFVVDVTALRNAQRELAAKERRLRGIFDAARDVALILGEPETRDTARSRTPESTEAPDSPGSTGAPGTARAARGAADFRISEFSAGAEQLFGYRVSEVLGRSVLELHPEEERAEMTERFRRVIQTGENLNEELYVLRRDGSSVPVLFTANPVFTPQGESGGIVVVAVDISERMRAERAVEASLREKEVLLQEIHHRVKNNMQIISSILSLEIGQLSDPAVTEALEISQSRIRSMSLIHEKLYQSGDLARVDLADYIGDLCRDLRAMSPEGAGISLELEAESVVAGVNLAIPFGLVVNELVTNAFKYAALGSEAIQVTVSLRMTSEGTELVVSDNGPGMPADFDVDANTSLGMELVRSLVSQLQGTVSYRSEGGVTWRVVIPPAGA